MYVKYIYILRRPQNFAKSPLYIHIMASELEHNFDHGSKMKAKFFFTPLNLSRKTSKIASSENLVSEIILIFLTGKRIDSEDFMIK